MKTNVAVAVLAAVSLSFLASGAFAGAIERACNKSDRGAANRAVCSCIQQVANITLGRSDQSRAAKLFGNPEKAHATWMSQSRNDDAFWERYKIFGNQVEAYCTGV